MSRFRVFSCAAGILLAGAAASAGCTRSPVAPPSAESLLNAGLPSTSDCASYDTASLRVEQEPDNWLLTDGFQRMFILATEEAAADALALARRYRTLCFIGRSNTRADRRAYIIHYWQNGSGLATTLADEDCDGYDAANLRVVSAGAEGWVLMDGGARLVLLDTEADAVRAHGVARLASARCYIGRDNTRADPRRFTVEYWQ